MEMGRISATEIAGREGRSFSTALADFAGVPSAAGQHHVGINALHLPAMIVAQASDGLHLTASNADLDALFPGGIASIPDLVPLLVDAIASGAVRSQFGWGEPGLSGRYFRAHFSRLSGPHEPVTQALVTLIDFTAEREAQRTLQAEMLRDGLTGLPNRLAFLEAVEAAVEAGGEQASFALIAVDLLRFSRVNEGVGALAADELILTVAHRLRAALAPGDILARTAGDEFGILIPLVDGPHEAMHAARKLHQSFEQPIRLSELEIKIDGAIGCALWGELTTGAIDVLGNLQVALKRAKASGRIELYRPGEVVAARRRFSLETDLRRAIARDELALAFQPLLDLETGTVTGFEALARWTHPDHGVISPAEFIPVAEESGLVLALGRWALDRAARTLAAWDAQAGRILPLQLNVNVSAVQLARDCLVDAVAASGIDPRRLTLELTESSIVCDAERASKVLKSLHELHCTIAMDDFGTGYSCLAYLQKLPIDVLKIDRSLVTDMHVNRDSMALVRAVLSLARALGMSTTAEGIERAETASMLAALGCATGQGFYFARPLGSDAALAYFLSGRA